MTQLGRTREHTPSTTSTVRMPVTPSTPAEKADSLTLLRLPPCAEAGVTLSSLTAASPRRSAAISSFPSPTASTLEPAPCTPVSPTSAPARWFASERSALSLKSAEGGASKVTYTPASLPSRFASAGEVRSAVRFTMP